MSIVMYHEPTLYRRGYYDTLEEMPSKAKVKFPDQKDYVEMTPSEVCALDGKDWYTVLHSVNWGCCDYWTSEKPSKWVRERFNHIIRYVNKKGETVGYNRAEWTIILTKDACVWEAEVWNS